MTPVNPPPLQGSSVQVGSLVGQIVPAAQSTPLGSNVQPPRRIAPLAQSTPLRPEAANNTATVATTTSHAPNIDYGDDDAIVNNVDGNLPSAVQNDLTTNQSQMHSNVPQPLDQMADGIQSIDTPDPNGPQVDSVQAVAAVPNENGPTQRVSVKRIKKHFHQHNYSCDTYFFPFIYSCSRTVLVGQDDLAKQIYQMLHHFVWVTFYMLMTMV